MGKWHKNVNCMHANINSGCDYESIYRYFERSDKILTEKLRW